MGVRHFASTNSSAGGRAPWHPSLSSRLLLLQNASSWDTRDTPCLWIQGTHGRPTPKITLEIGYAENKSKSPVAEGSLGSRKRTISWRPIKMSRISYSQPECERDQSRRVIFLLESWETWNNEINSPTTRFPYRKSMSNVWQSAAHWEVQGTSYKVRVVQQVKYLLMISHTLWPDRDPSPWPCPSYGIIKVFFETLESFEDMINWPSQLYTPIE